MRKINRNDLYLKVKKEDTETKTEEVEASNTKEIKTITKEVGLGTYSSVVYSENDSKEYEKMCVDLLKIYNLSQLKFVEVKEYGVDFL